MWVVIIALAVILFVLVHANLARARINKQLEASNITKDRFFSLIAHDLRSPISGAIGLSEVIRDGTEDIKNSRLNYYSKSLNSTLNEVNSLIENLLQWSHNETGRMSYYPKGQNVFEVIENTISLLKDVFAFKEIEVVNQVPNDLIIFSDSNMLSAIFRNILANSSKYTDTGGRVVISSDKLSASTEIYIEDNGIGIPSEKLNDLFNQKFAYSTPGTRQEQGTGLGLMLCKEFMTRHDGAIKVESIEGKGTKIILQFPSLPDSTEV